MLTLQNVADVIKLKGVAQNFGISNIFIKNCENAKICFQLLQNIK